MSNSELYNSSDTSYKMVQFKQLLQSEITENCLQEANRITGAAVKEAVCRMEPDTLFYLLIQCFAPGLWMAL